LTQFYPDAATNYPPNVAVPKFESGAIGTLTWTDLTIGPGASGPATDSHVWLAPRNVKADDVTATNGESERYLFYRGVGRLDAPLKVVRAGDELQLNKEIKLHHLWYFEVRTDGSYAYRTLKPDARSTPADFTPQEYRHESLSNLRRDMKAALVESGLFDDEAEAMLETWKESYFKSPGTRLFFIVPREWTDRHLPIRLSQPAKIERVMVGRIDLVTPRHRQIIQRVMQLANEGNSPEAQQLIAELGRFGAAMIADAKSGGC
jgi:hypothetical protein